MTHAASGAGPTRVLLDLGDLFTKALVIHRGGRRHLRFPSAAATSLLRPDDAGADPLLPGAPFPRLGGLSAGGPVRERSYPGGATFLREASVRGTPGGLYAGWLAAAYGRDRRLLGQAPDEALVSALTRKALLLAGATGEVELGFVIDASPKRPIIEKLARSLAGALELSARRLRDGQERRVRLHLRCRLLDAAACAREMFPDPAARLLVLDIGYFRSKLAVLTPEGCEREADLAAGVSDCARRVLRDGQGLGLAEDELAVVRALEVGGGILRIAGREYDVRDILSDAERALTGELVAACRRTLLDAFARQGEPCKVVALAGGGARRLGGAVGARLVAGATGIERCRSVGEPELVLVDGAARLVARE